MMLLNSVVEYLTLIVLLMVSPFVRMQRALDAERADHGDNQQRMRFMHAHTHAYAHTRTFNVFAPCVKCHRIRAQPSPRIFVSTDDLSFVLGTTTLRRLPFDQC